LFGLSTSQRIAGPELPLNEFQARGGATADNPGGWGIAWLDDNAATPVVPRLATSGFGRWR